MELDAKICKVRSWREDDFTALARHADDPGIAAQLRDRFPHPYTEKEARRWVKMALGERRPSHFAIEAEKSCVGAIGLVLGTDVERVSAEVGLASAHLVRSRSNSPKQ